MATAGYSGTPLPKKLGIKDGSRVLLVAAPADVDETLGVDDPETFPDDVTIVRRARAGASAEGTHDVIVLFVTERAKFETELPLLERRIFPAGGLWIAWPKKAAKTDTDMTEDVVREVALPRGLVDNKVCAIDATWSGLRVVWRKELRG